MEQEQDPPKEYIKSFNQGYDMQQHEPELLSKLLSGNDTNERIKAMKAGKQHYEREQFLLKMAEVKRIEKGKER